MIESTSCLDCSKPPRVSSEVLDSLQQNIESNTHQVNNIKQSENNQPTVATTTPSSDQQYQSQASSFKRASSQQNQQSRLNYFRPQQQPTTTITIATPHYHQHRLLLTPQSPFLLPGTTGFNTVGHPASSLSHHHHFPDVAASALTTASTISGATNGSFQPLSLSPDARACFTATYLCVLIVNNTWLDCNLLEMLCNGTTTTDAINRRQTNERRSDDDDDDDDDLQSEKNRRQLEAFETILSELVAFAGGGGGQNEGGSDGDSSTSQSFRLHELLDRLGRNGGNLSSRSPRDGIYISPVNLEPDREPELPRHVVPPDEGGGIHSNNNNNASLVSLFYNGNRPAVGATGPEPTGYDQVQKQSRDSDQQQYPKISMAKLNQLSEDDDQAVTLRQYFDSRRSQLAAQKQATEMAANHPTETSQPQDINSPSASREETTFISTVMEDKVSTTQAPNSNSPGLITNWISRPLRDWGSYLFWSSTPSGDLINQSSTTTTNSNNNNNINFDVKITADESTADGQSISDLRAKQEANKQQQQQQQQQAVQILRPVDRTDNYNTISTNQTIQKQQQLILELPQNLPTTLVTTNNHRSSSTSLQNSRHNQQNLASMQLPVSQTTRTNGPSSIMSPGFPLDLADQMSIPLTKLVSDLVGSSSSVSMAEIDQQRQQSSTPAQQQHTPSRQQQIINSRPQEGSFVNNMAQIRPAYETQSPSNQASIQVFRDSLNQQQFMSNHQQQQNIMFNRQQQQQQQQQSQNQYPIRMGDECDCNMEFLTDTDQSTSPNLFNTYSSENCHNYCQLRVGGIIPTINNNNNPPTTPSLLDQQTSPVTSFSTTSSTSLTTSGAPVVVVPSGGKMNPLDVTFLLYTRRHREIINGGSIDMEDLMQTSPSTRNPLTSSSVSPSPSSSSLSSSASSAATAVNINGSNNNRNIGQQQQQHHQYNGDEVGDKNLAHNSLNSSHKIGLGEILDLNNEDTFSESSFNGSLPVKLIIHGFGSGGRRLWVTDMVYKLLDYENVNVIVVDWEKGATLPNYVQAAGNTRLVGHKIASLIRMINVRYALTANSYHLIGFSLGAHVAGFAGMEIRNSTNISHHWINRITGLDPASPLFEGYEADDRLDPSDAQFVDVIHSNGDGVLRGGFGSLQPMGHVDFYPNGGRVQVGCNSVLLSALSDIIYGKWQSLCNHRRALNFFMDSFESFDRCKFRSFNCDSYESYLKGDCFDCGLNEERCSYMGYLANHSKGRGRMYLTTHEEAPFCANQFLIKIIGSKGFKTQWGKVEVTLVGQDGRNESFWLSATSQQSSSSPSSSSSSSSSSLSSSSSSSNNHHEMPNSQKDLVQHSMQSLIVSHFTLANLTHILLRYTKYRGWIYSGGESWSIDKVFLTDSDGRVKSYCGFSTALESHITTRLNLESGNCTVSEASMVTPAGQISRASGPTTIGGSNTLTTNNLQQQQQQQQQNKQQQPQSNQPRGHRLFSPMIQSLGEQQAPSIMINGHTFQLRSSPANDWHQQLSQLGFGKLHNPSSPMIAT